MANLLASYRHFLTKAASSCLPADSAPTSMGDIIQRVSGLFLKDGLVRPGPPLLIVCENLSDHFTAK